MKCRECGCYAENACSHPETGATCAWVEEDLCSGCGPEPFLLTPTLFLPINFPETARHGPVPV